MNQWTDTSAALSSLDPIAGMSPEQRNRLAFFANEDRADAMVGGLRQRLASGLLRVAIMLDGRAQQALIEAGGER